jgi:outer membrane protein TolC
MGTSSIQGLPDSLALKDVINQVVKNNPSIKIAEENISSDDSKISLAKAGYYPNLDINASYTRIGPVPILDFPSFVEFKLYPENNYSANLNFEMNVYDFGKTAKNIDIAEENKMISEQTLEQIKQKLAQMVINNFFSLVYLQEAIKIKDEEIQTLKEHLDYIEKKEATGSAIQYEILSTKVKISNVENQKVDLVTTLKVQISYLNSLIGEPEGTYHYAKNESIAILPKFEKDSLVFLALNNRDEMKIAKEKLASVELSYTAAKKLDNPIINIFASGGGKNGYIPDLNVIKLNYVAGIGLKIPLFDGTRTQNRIRLAESSIKTTLLDNEITQRSITHEVVENEANMKASLQKVDQFELQFRHAQQAYNLAEINFKLGVITNLELLDASTSVSESRLFHLKSKIDYLINLYRLKASIGERLY